MQELKEIKCFGRMLQKQLPNSKMRSTEFVYKLSNFKQELIKNNTILAANEISIYNERQEKKRLAIDFMQKFAKTFRRIEKIET